MKKKLAGIFLVVSFMFIFAGSASASDYLQKINFGYAYNAIGDLNEALALGIDLSEHNFYMENVSLFGIDVVPNLYIGAKNNLSFSLSSNNNAEQVLLRHTGLLLVVEYNYPVKDSGFTVGAAFNAGFNSVNLVIREFTPGSNFDKVVGDRSYTNIWRPYFAVGGSINAAYHLSSLIQLNLNAGAVYNIGIGEWLDIFDKIEGSSEILQGFVTVFATFGIGFSF